MDYELFASKFPKIGGQTTRTITVPAGQALPQGSFGFLPLYCKGKNCDCRRAMILVIKEKEVEPMANLSYGWEPLAFYQNWFGGSVPEDIVINFKGPGFTSFATQGPYANHFLKIFKEMLAVKEYADRFLTEYALFKRKIGMKLPPELAQFINLKAPCPCRSGKNLGACCGNFGTIGRFRR